MDNAIWKCSCGQENDGKFCINCGTMRPEAAPAAVAPTAPVEAVAPVAPVTAAPVEPVAPVAVAPVAPVEPVVPAAVEPAAPVAAVAPVAPVAAAVAPVEPVAPAAVVPAAPVEAVAPVAVAAAAVAAAPEVEPVQVVKCQPMPVTPVEDFSNAPNDAEFEAAAAVPVQPVYQPEPAPVPVQTVGNPAPKVIGPVNYQNTSSNPYSEPDRASHNPYAQQAAKPQAQAYGTAAAPTSSAGTGVLVLGIISIIIGWSLSILGIILSIVGIASASSIKSQYGGVYPNGKTKVGSILSKIALPVSILCLLVHIIVIVLAVILGKNVIEWIAGFFK